MITFDSSYTRLGFSVAGAIDEVPINSYLREVHIDRIGVIVMDTTGNWGHIHYQDTSFNSNIELFNYLYNYKSINTPITKKIEICGADLEFANSIPIDLFAEVGNGLIAVPHSMSYIFKFIGSQVFDFADDLYIHCSTKDDTNAIFQIVGSVINSPTDYSTVMPIITGTEQFVENDNWVLKARTSDSTESGTGTLTIYLTYSIVEENWYDGVYCS